MRGSKMTNLNLPYNESLAREVIAALQGVVFRNNFDPRTVPLESILASPDAMFGTRMYAITEGPGSHKTYKGLCKVLLPKEGYDVPEGEVYATIDTIACLSGSCATYVFDKQQDGSLKLKDEFVHMRS
jgi:hypothetical protein